MVVDPQLGVAVDPQLGVVFWETTPAQAGLSAPVLQAVNRPDNWRAGWVHTT